MSGESRPADKTVSEEDQARSHLYHLLGRLLAGPPGEDILELLVNIDGTPGDGESMASAWAGLRAAAQSAKPVELEREYFGLFVGLGRGELVPFASSYIDGALMERTLASLRQDLKRLGFERADNVAEPEDHAAALCETMGMIIADSQLSLEEAAFYEAYIASWMPRFFADLAAAEAARFYGAVGILGSRFLDIEQSCCDLPRT